MSKNINYNIKVGVIGDAQLQKFQRTVEKINKSTAKSTKSIAKMSKSMDLLGRAARTAGTAMAVFYSAKGLVSIINQADAIRNLEASFTVLLGSAERAESIMQDLFDIAKETGAPINDVASAAQRLAVGLNEMGASNEQITQITETFIKLGRLGGASMADVNGALIQFSQGLASGRLQGDEFRSISERLPLVMRELSKELGVTIGELKQMGSDGEITADVMGNAMLNATVDTNEAFKLLPRTFEQVTNNFNTMLTSFLRSKEVITTIEAITAALQWFTERTKSFISNLQEIIIWVGKSETALSLLKGAAISLGIVLMTAFPILGVVAAIALIISYWDDLLLYFRYKVPAELAKVNLSWKTWLANLRGLIRKGLMLIVNVAIDLVGMLLNALNPVKKIVDLGSTVAEAMGVLPSDMREFSQSLVDANNLLSGLKYTTDDLANATEHTKEELDALDEAFTRVVTTSTLYEEELAKLQEEQAKSRAEAELFVKSQLGVGKSTKNAAKAAKEAKEKLTELEKQTIKNIKAFEQMVESNISTFFSDIIDGSKSGKEAFNDFALSLLNDMANMITQMLVIKPLMNSLFGVSGSGGGLLGGLIPTSVVPTQSSASVMSRATPEKPSYLIRSPQSSIMANLMRSSVVPMASSNSSSVGGVKLGASPITVNITNNSKNEVEVAETIGNDGSRTLEVLIEGKVKDAFSSGRMDKSMKMNYGVRRVGS